MKASRTLFRIACRILAGIGAATAVAALGACGTGDAASPAVVVVDASAATSAPSGAQLVQARGCAQCHQPSDSSYGVLSGQTIARPGTRAYGRNLTPDKETGIGAWTDEAILRAIRGGLDDQGSPLCATMPAFSDIGDTEGAAIVAYLRSLPPVKREIPNSVCADAARDPNPEGGSPAAPREAGAGGDATAEPTDSGDSGDSGVTSADGGDSGVTIIADADAGADAGACAMLAPNAPGDCHGCTVAASCNPNGCHGGYWCAPATHTCHRRPPNCR